MKTPIEKFVTAVDTDKLRRDFLDLFEEEPLSRIREWADSLSEVADAVDEAKDRIEAWAMAGEEGLDREQRAYAKDEALEALETLTNVWTASPLDLDKMEDWEPSAEDIG